jgi:hypothetical protein
MKILQVLLFDFTSRIDFCVSFNIDQFKWTFTHIIQVFIKILCKFSKCECHMLFSSFQLNLDIIT